MTACHNWRKPHIWIFQAGLPAAVSRTCVRDMASVSAWELKACFMVPGFRYCAPHAQYIFQKR